MMHLPALLLLHLCSAANPVQRVLFVGNSYTYVNDLPNMYRQLAGSLLPDTTITVTSDTAGGRALEAAATVPSVLDKLAAGDFDFLVLQEQSTLSATPNSGKYSSYAWQRTMCEDAVRTVFAPAAKKANATVVFFETWGRRHNEAEKYTGHTTYLGMQRSVCDGYAVYADIARREACSTVATARAGEVYKKVYEAGLPSGDPSLDTASSFYQLYSGDGSHPAVSGTYAIAWSLFVAITHNAQQFNPQTTYTAGLPTEQASTLAQYAGEVYQEYRSVAPEITALRGAYPTGRYIIRKDVISVWGGPQDDVSNVYPLEVVNGSVFWAEQNASVVEVEEIPAKVTWSDGTVIANNAVVCEWRSATPATSAPTTAEPIATLPGTGASDTTASPGSEMPVHHSVVPATTAPIPTSTVTPATETATPTTPLRTLTPPTPTALHGTARCSTRPCETENTMCKEADGGHTCVSYAAAECCAERPACTSGLRASTQPCTEEEAVKGSCVWVALCCEEVFCREGGDDGTPVWVWVLVGVGAVVAILAAVAVASFLFCGAGKTLTAFSLMDEDFVAMEERTKDSV